MPIRPRPLGRTALDYRTVAGKPDGVKPLPNPLGLYAPPHNASFDRLLRAHVSPCAI
jgi:hypothetical protein